MKGVQSLPRIRSIAGSLYTLAAQTVQWRAQELIVRGAELLRGDFRRLGQLFECSLARLLRGFVYQIISANHSYPVNTAFAIYLRLRSFVMVVLLASRCSQRRALRGLRADEDCSFQ